MLENPVKSRTFKPYRIWGALMVLTIAYGFTLAFIEYGTGGFAHIAGGLWRIMTGPALIFHDYIAMVGIGPALVNSGISSLIMLGAFKLARQPCSGSQMAVCGLVMGFALMGKNPANILPILFGAYLYSLYKKVDYKEIVTVSGFATCLAPIVSQPPHIPEIVALIGVGGGVVMGLALGIFLGFIMNAVAANIRKSHEGLNLYNMGWAAGLVAIALTMIYTVAGIERFGPGITPGYILGGYTFDEFWNPIALSPIGSYNALLYGYVIFVSLYFITFGLLAGARFRNLKQILNLKAGDAHFLNNYYAKYGQGPVYMAMGFLGVLTLVLTLPLQVNLTGPIVGAIMSMVGWGGFGKSVANAAAIISGVLVAATARYFISPNFLREGYNLLTYFSTQTVIWTSAFWGTCLSPMARFFGWKWAIPIGMVHFAFAYTIAPFHWGQNLYNNGLAAGFVCMVMIPIIRAFDKKGKYNPENVYPSIEV
ncbi:MAG: DUF1576 domain-containing protein [Clostridiales bacterium]|jgi:hypothetical protein|nr:DUF1576 domain-containing protein [Clostridiales bacterium]